VARLRAVRHEPHYPASVEMYEVLLDEEPGT
jgi:hypothetical protein